MKSLIRFSSHLLPMANPKLNPPWSRYRHGCDPPHHHYHLVAHWINVSPASRLNFYLSVAPAQNWSPTSVTVLSSFQQRFLIHNRGSEGAQRIDQTWGKWEVTQTDAATQPTTKKEGFMKHSTTHLALFGSAILTLALGFGTTVQVQAGESSPSSAQPDQEIQDRAVPRMGIPNEQFEQVQPPPRMRQGFVRQGNTIMAQPGYVLEPGPNNQVTARIAGGSGGGQGATSLSCRCTGADGIMFDKTCTTTIIGSEANCVKGPGATCDAKCAWASITTGFSPGGKAMQ